MDCAFSAIFKNLLQVCIIFFLFSFCWQWTDTSYTSLYLNDTKVFANLIETVSVKSGVAFDQLGTSVAQCAASLFVAIPLLFLFVICQNFFVKSISQTGLSGG